jgi:hypothetical protein
LQDNRVLSRDICFNGNGNHNTLFDSKIRVFRQGCARIFNPSRVGNAVHLRSLTPNRNSGLFTFNPYQGFIRSRASPILLNIGCDIATAPRLHQHYVPYVKTTM